MRARLAGAIAVAIAVPSVAAAATIRPVIRVEGGTGGTLVHETRIPVATAGTTTVADTTDTDAISVATDSATAQLARATGLFGLPLGFDIFNFGGPSSFVTQIGTDKMPPSFSPSWRVKVNHKDTTAGADTTILKRTDSVLWTFGVDFEAPELDVTVPASIRAGRSFVAHVTEYDKNGAGTPASGARVRFGGSNFQTDANGNVTLPTSVSGTRFVSAAHTGMIRSPRRLVCVHNGGGAPCSAIQMPQVVGPTTPTTRVISGQTTGDTAQVTFFRFAAGASPAAAQRCRFLRADRTTLTPPGPCNAPIWLPTVTDGGLWTFAFPATAGASGRFIVQSRARTGRLSESTAMPGTNRIVVRVPKP